MYYVYNTSIFISSFSSEFFNDIVCTASGTKMLYSHILTHLLLCKRNSLDDDKWSKYSKHLDFWTIENHGKGIWHWLGTIKSNLI